MNARRRKLTEYEKSIPPKWAIILGIWGLVPFVLGAILAQNPDTSAAIAFPGWLQTFAYGQDLLLRYGQLALPFSGAIFWGFATNFDGWRGGIAYVFSVLPLLYVFFAIDNTETGIFFLAVGFILLFILDFILVLLTMTPKWWLLFRAILVVITTFSLLAGSYA